MDHKISQLVHRIDRLINKAMDAGAAPTDPGLELLGALRRRALALIGELEERPEHRTEMQELRRSVIEEWSAIAHQARPYVEGRPASDASARATDASGMIGYREIRPPRIGPKR